MVLAPLSFIDSSKIHLILRNPFFSSYMIYYLLADTGHGVAGSRTNKYNYWQPAGHVCRDEKLHLTFPTRAVLLRLRCAACWPPHAAYGTAAQVPQPRLSIFSQNEFCQKDRFEGDIK